LLNDEVNAFAIFGRARIIDSRGFFVAPNTGDGKRIGDKRAGIAAGRIEEERGRRPDGDGRIALFVGKPVFLAKWT
jgi:hypothetical protein